MAVESGVASENAVEVIREVAVPVRATGDPQVFGWLAFVVGSTCLGLSLVGFVPAGTLGAPLAIIFGCTALALVISTIWAANLGQSYVAGAFGIFSTFWVSYTGLVLGLTHGWFAIAPEAVGKTVLAFLAAWAVGIGLLTLSSVRLPVAYTIDIALVDLALIVLYFANDSASAGLTKLGGYIVLSFAALGAYIWLSVADQSLGGPGYPMGKPLRT
ncbi:MAG: GPR1/FUN34/YaaH family transporter [Acidimicrobiia bacterium]